MGGLLEATDQDWEEAFLLNAKSVFWAMQAALPKMAAQGGGSVINIASVAAFKMVPGRFIYSATKAALVAMTKAAALEFAPKGVRVNAICPGTVDTPPCGRGPEGRRALGPLPRGNSSSAWAVPRRSPPWRSTWPRTRGPSPREAPSWWTGG